MKKLLVGLAFLLFVSISQHAYSYSFCTKNQRDCLEICGGPDKTCAMEGPEQCPNHGYSCRCTPCR